MKILYAISGMLAGMFILVMCVVIAAQIVMRQLGVVVPGADEVAISAFIAAIFLGLPYTLWTNGHIRADVLVNLTRGRLRWLLELIAYMVAILFIAFFIYFAADMAWDSYLRGARFQGLLGSPLWVPQGTMVLGLALFEAALIHGLLRIVGRPDDSFPNPPGDEGAARSPPANRL